MSDVECKEQHTPGKMKRGKKGSRHSRTSENDEDSPHKGIKARLRNSSGNSNTPKKTPKKIKEVPCKTVKQLTKKVRRRG